MWIACCSIPWSFGGERSNVSNKSEQKRVQIQSKECPPGGTALLD